MVMENIGTKQTIVNGERRKSKASDLTQKKNKQPQRGMGVEQLERIRLHDMWKKMTPQHPPHLPFPISPPPPAMLFSSGHPSRIFQFQNPRELSSVTNYIKCASDGCGVCHKKKRINTVVEVLDAGKTRRTSGQVNDRNGGSSVTEYEFFPGKLAWCGSGSGGMIELRGGEGSCVTGVSGSEEGSVYSVDLSLKL